MDHAHTRRAAGHMDLAHMGPALEHTGPALEHTGHEHMGHTSQLGVARVAAQAEHTSAAQHDYTPAANHTRFDPARVHNTPAGHTTSWSGLGSASAKAETWSQHSGCSCSAHTDLGLEVELGDTVAARLLDH